MTTIDDLSNWISDYRRACAQIAWVRKCKDENITLFDNVPSSINIEKMMSTFSIQFTRTDLLHILQSRLDFAESALRNMGVKL